MGFTDSQGMWLPFYKILHVTDIAVDSHSYMDGFVVIHPQFQVLLVGHRISVKTTSPTGATGPQEDGSWRLSQVHRCVRGRPARSAESR